MAIYLRRSSLSVCPSWQRLMMGDRRDMRDGGRWAPGTRCLSRSWGSRGRAAAGARAKTDLWVPGPGPDPGRICEDLCKQRTLSKLWEATVEINCQPVSSSEYTHSYDSPTLFRCVKSWRQTNFIAFLRKFYYWHSHLQGVPKKCSYVWKALP